MSEIPRSAEYLVDLVVNVPGLLKQVSEHPEETLRELAAQTTKRLPPPPTVTDVWIYRVVVCSLGIVVIIAVIGAIYLSSGTAGKAPPDVLTALGSAAIGALAGLLAPSPVGK